MTVYLNQGIPQIKVSYSFLIPVKDRYSIKSSINIFNLLNLIWDKDLIGFKEQFKIVCLNNANVVLGVYDLSEGGIQGTFVDIRIVFATALAALSTGIILVHNHPSCTLEPSEADKTITKRIKGAADLLNITLLDHIIITPDETYFSFADGGLL